MRLIAIACLALASCASSVMVVKVHCDGKLAMVAETTPGSGMLHPIPHGHCMVGVDNKE